MNVKADGSVSARTAVRSERVVAFSPEKVQAPFSLRCGALLLDYLIVVAIPVLCLLLGRMSGDDGAKLLSGGWNTAGWLIAILLAATNLVVLPVLTGQSVGKIATGTRIVAIDGTPASHRSILMRQTFGYLLTVFSFGIGFLLSVFSSKGRAIHDYVSGTVVIFADRKLRQR